MGGHGRRAENPRLGIRRAIERAVDLSSLRRGATAIDAQVVEIRLALSTICEFFGKEFDLGRRGSGDRQFAREHAAISSGGPHRELVAGCAGDRPVHCLRSICHTGTAAAYDDVRGARIFHIHEECAPSPDVKTFFAGRYVAAVEIDAPLEGKRVTDSE